MKHTIALVLAFFAVGCSLSTFLGYVISRDILSSWIPSGQRMAVSTAAALVALSVALIVHLHEHKKNKETK